MIPLKLKFLFSDGENHNASLSEISESIELCHNYGWLLVPKSDSLDGNPMYSFEISDDDINWQAYESRTENAAIDQGFDDTHMLGTFVRINYNALTNTLGTVAFDITLKQL